MFKTTLKKVSAGITGVALMAASSLAQAEVTFPTSVFANLDYGLYWFGYNSAQKAVPGQSNAFYAPHKDTVIFIHGWQNNTVTKQKRATLYRESNEDLSAYWLDRGYNVGIMYWNQFADEGEVKDAEAKIYSANGPRSMRWKDVNGNYNSGPGTAVKDLFFTEINNNMQNFTGGHFRLAGHSLGNQVVLAVGDMLNTAVNSGALPASLRPDRVALLDPFYSQGDKSYLGGKWPGEVARENADRLRADGALLEAYRSSPVTSTFLVGDANTALMNKTAFAELRPWYYNWLQVAEKHNSVIMTYFWSIGYDAPNMTNSSKDGLSAATSSARVLELMNANYQMDQVEGRYTYTPGDDQFQQESR